VAPGAAACGIKFKSSETLVRFFKKVLDRIGLIERGLGVALIFLIVIAISTQVFTRYVLGRPIAWVEESATYAFIWMVFIGSSYGLKQGRHILINTFASRLPPKLAAAMRLIVWLMILGLLTVLVVQGFKVMGVEGRSKTISLPIELPRSWFYSLPLTLSAASMFMTTFYLALLEWLSLTRPAASVGKATVTT
jgi:TRAP-type transport system small permease protein